ncbi:hypothetical protein ACU635_07165 [[Actinomadura] parvosata]|uniref:hypothetical protein n=1 Tax=[Actinomadura] parvosata TaxID=1955412 RepID=UPI00406C6A1E
MYYLPEIDRLPQRYYKPGLRPLVGVRAPAVIDGYRRECLDLTTARAGNVLSGDVGFRMLTIRMAEARSARGVPALLYLATVTSPDAWTAR